MSVDLQPPPDPCPDCGYEHCVCDQPLVRFPDYLEAPDDDDEADRPADRGVGW